MAMLRLRQVKVCKMPLCTLTTHLSISFILTLKRHLRCLPMDLNNFNLCFVMTPIEFKKLAMCRLGRFASDSRLDCSLDLSEPTEELFDDKQDDVMSTLFMPDPLTGYPSSDLSVILSKDSSPIVSQYIRDNLMRPIDSESSDDPDLALGMVKDRNERWSDFIDRIKSIVKPSGAVI